MRVYPAIVFMCLIATRAFALQPDLNPVIESLSEAGESGQVIVVFQGEVVLEAAIGEASAGQEVEPETLFYIGSIAKVMTSAAVICLADKGSLDLDDSIGMYIDDVPDDKKGITVRMLLAHTSGLRANHTDPTSTLDRDEFVEWALGTRLLSEPSSEWSYSNVGYALLTVVLEEVTGEPYQNVIRRLVTQPANMTQTWFMTDDFNRDGAAVGSGPSLQQFGVDGHAAQMEWTWLRAGAGGMFSTASDLLRLHNAIDLGDVLTPAQLKLVTTPVLSPSYGLGWRLSGTGNGVHYHDGSFPGFNAEFFRLPQHDGVIIVLSNQDGGARRMRMKITAAFEED
jgi:CubicO group peptidase (beta-lactamase class C family)